MFGFNEYNQLTEQQHRVLGLKPLAEEVDSYIINVLKAREWEPTLENYRDVVKEMMNLGHIDERELSDIKIKKLHQVMKYLIELVRFKKLRKEIDAIK